LESAKQIILEEGLNNEKLRKKEENLRMSMAVTSATFQGIRESTVARMG
jgi:hypothetical protein